MKDFIVDCNWGMGADVMLSHFTAKTPMNPESLEMWALSADEARDLADDLYKAAKLANLLQERFKKQNYEGTLSKL